MNLSLILFAIGTAFFLKAIRQHRRLRQIEDTPRSKTSTAAQGLVELQGFAWPEGETYKLGDQQEVVYYLNEIQYRRSALYFFNSQSKWETVAKRVHAVPFYLIDATGIVKIDPTNAEAFLDGSKTKSWSDLTAEQQKDFIQREFKAPIPVLSQIMRAYRTVCSASMMSPAFFFGFIFWLYDKALFTFIPHYPPSSTDKQYRIVESWIEVGSPLYVSGSFQTPKIEQSSLQQKGLSAFVENIFGTSLHVLDESAQIMGSQDFKKDYVTFAHQARRETNGEEQSFPVYGVVRANSPHTLFIGDGFESHLKEKLKAWLPARFILGAAVMALGVSLFAAKLLQETNKIEKRKQASRAVAQIRPLAQLHSQCVEGLREACQELVTNQSTYRLPEKNLQYYKNRLEPSQK